MNRLRAFVLVVAALAAGAIPAQAAKICQLPLFGPNVALLLTCPSDECLQIMPLAVDAPVIVVRPEGDWSRVRARNPNNVMIEGFVRSQFICNGQ
jgi:hypothetical protein